MHKFHKLFYLHQRKGVRGVSTEVRSIKSYCLMCNLCMNYLKAENKSIDRQCVKVITNCNLVLHSLSFLSINQMMG